MRRFLVLGAAGLFALVVGVADASAATLYSQSNVLRGNDTGTCNGGSKGSCKVVEIGAIGTSATQADNVKVQCTVKNAPANTFFEVFWTCTTAARGCHNQACGFISLGGFVTTSTGRGKFAATKGNNPFPGNYVHLDLLGGGQTYTAVYGAIPIGVGPAAAAEGAQAGDPTSR